MTLPDILYPAGDAGTIAHLGCFAYGLSYARSPGMNATPVAVEAKNGDCTRVIAGPMNRSEEPRFGLADGLIIAFFALLAIGIGCWFVLK
jgi:hypothetical protein